MKTETQKMFELAKQLQLLAHEYGYETFKGAIIQSLFDASVDTQDFESKILTQRYQYLANAVCDASIEEPEFDPGGDKD